MFGKKVHGLQEFVCVDEWTNNNQSAKYIPQPEIERTEPVRNRSTGQFTTDPLTESMTPNKIDDPKSKRSKDEEDQAVVHGFFPVVTTCDHIDVRTHNRHDDQTVNAEGNERQQDKF